MTHPFLKLVRPVNLLSFGPETQPIELRALNILIGPNGCGKSNVLEIIGLLKDLPDKDPWSTPIETGGATEWIWKGEPRGGRKASLFVRAAGQRLPPRADGKTTNAGFRPNNLPGTEGDIEDIRKEDLEPALINATRDTKTKGKYHKIVSE